MVKAGQNRNGKSKMWPAILRLRWEVLDGSYLERWISELDLKQEWSNAKRMAEIAEST